MENHYVLHNENGYHLTGSRVSLDSIVYDWLAGLSPESIAENFETLNLEQVYGAVAFYLAHREQVDQHLERQREKFATLRDKALLQHARLAEKLASRCEATA